MIFWEDVVPQVTEIKLSGSPEALSIKNVWSWPDRQCPISWVMNAAMIVEEIPNGRLYRCNDGAMDEDFDDIVFTLERLPA